MGADEQSDYGPTWYSGVTPLPPPRTPLNYDLDVDVCVIGGGLAGLTTAREVARRGWSVAVVEARRVAWNASGRNSGFVSPGYSAQIEKIVERIGLPAAKALWELSEAGVQYVHDTIEEIGGRGIVEGKGSLEVFKTPDAGRATARLRLLEQEMGVAVAGGPMERGRASRGTRRDFLGVDVSCAAHNQPLGHAP